MLMNFFKMFLGSTYVNEACLMSSEFTKIWLVRRCKLVAAMALTRQSACDVNYCYSYGLVTYTIISSPSTLTVFTVVCWV